MAKKQEGEKTLEEVLQEKMELRDGFILKADRVSDDKVQQAEVFQMANAFQKEIEVMAQALEGGTA